MVISKKTVLQSNNERNIYANQTKNFNKIRELKLYCTNQRYSENSNQSFRKLGTIRVELMEVKPKKIYRFHRMDLQQNRKQKKANHTVH